MEEELDESQFVPDYEEEDVQPGPAYGSTAKIGRGRRCCLCTGRFTHVRRHTIREHLPWYCYPFTACWKCKCQFGLRRTFQKHAEEFPCRGREDQVFQESEWLWLMYGFLLELATRLISSASIEGLFHHACNIGLLQKYSGSTFLLEDMQMVQMFHSSLNVGTNVVCDVTVSPIRMYSLLHWRVLSSLVYSSESPEDLINFEPKKIEEGGATKLLCDSHFHLDTLTRRTNCSGLQNDDDGSPKLEYAIANYCWPRNWPSSTQRNIIRGDKRIRISFGIHPRVAGFESKTQIDSWLRNMVTLSEARGVVAIGECGLDTSSGVSLRQYQLQQEVFSKQLSLATRRQLPVIIHCRGDRETADKCLDIMLKSLPKEQSVHRHCFTGSYQEYQQWKQAFPQCKFGVTPLVLRPDSPLCSLVQQIPLDDLLLESDAPCIPACRGGTAHPMLIKDVAVKIATIKNLSLELVLDTTFRNSIQLYQISHG